MDFELPEELKMIQSLTRDFVNDQLRPLERDILGRAADLSDARMALSAPPPGLKGTRMETGLLGNLSAAKAAVEKPTAITRHRSKEIPIVGNEVECFLAMRFFISSSFC